MKSTRPLRVYPEDIDKLYAIAGARFLNRNLTKEKDIPTPSKVLNLILRNPKIIEIIKTEVYHLPAKEDLVNEIQ
jgi:hypothetical protein